jgi:hypothetical protein
MTKYLTKRANVPILPSMALHLQSLQEPEPLGGRADEHLRVIRSAMERAGAFTAVPGWGGVAMGIVALATAAVAHRVPRDGRWVAIWVAAALFAFAIGATAIVLKARRSGTPLFGGVSRRFYLTLGAPIAVGVLLTGALAAHGAVDLLPGLWLLLYGAAVLSAGATSVPLVPTLGYCFMGVGAIALLSPAAWGDGFMAFGFGFLQIAFGVAIARRHGG